MLLRNLVRKKEIKTNKLNYKRNVTSSVKKKEKTNGACCMVYKTRICIWYCYYCNNNEMNLFIISSVLIHKCVKKKLL